MHSEDAKRNAGTSLRQPRAAESSPTKSAFSPWAYSLKPRIFLQTLDGAIEKNYKAALIAKGLDKEHIRFNAKNGVLTLKGSVASTPERQEAQQLAQAVPNVQQVLNQIDVKVFSHRNNGGRPFSCSVRKGSGHSMRMPDSSLREVGHGQKSAAHQCRIRKHGVRPSVPYGEVR